MKERTRSKRRLLWLSRFFGVASIFMLAAGTALTWSQYRANKATDYRAAQVVHAADTDHGNATAPSTVKPAPGAFDSYQVPPADPRYIFIAKLSVKAMVRPLGLTADNHLAAPTNVYDAGWYNQSAKPGDPGALVLDGHVSSWTAHGIFYGLKNLRAGDTLQVERGDGKTFTYKVVKSQVYDAASVDMQAGLSPIDPDKPGLNLITCDGSVVKGTNDFNKRLVIFTEQV